MSRVQLALNVSNLDEAIEFYSKLFGTEPNKRRVGYANFAIEEPSLKLVLIENPNADTSLNHLGVEVSSSEEVLGEKGRLQALGLNTAEEEGVRCCFALQDKIWVGAPDGEPWEIYTVLEDIESTSGLRDGVEQGEPCCGSIAELDVPTSSCC